MRELHLSHEESTETFLVLIDTDGVRYQLARAELQDEREQREPAAEAQSTGSTLFAVPSADDTPAPAEAEGAAEADVTPADFAEAGADGADPAAAEAPAPKERTLPEPDPLYATALSRVEPYAHPVLLERSQVAEAAKQSHPLREDGPAKLTLFEILASAFAARGHSLADASWDATREPGDAWVVHVRWQAGLTDNEALWSYTRKMGSAATTEARNAVAADLTDPDFVQPVRSLTAVDTQSFRREAEPELSPADAEFEGEETVAEGDFLRHPDEEAQPQQRRRKAVTPHWEDVLLGVRTTPKRPKK
ncbi:DUF3071 domain-containing protein [Corynebacterium sp. CNCTC7651]|uniref:septation protein SepH n=1 Tax=Corynebacterium sp. CNCTC7651 TaxID=2815361 RepID=UPI001EED6409|nr:septation protein SepH [Corynebacterium sp. CNCTC7651]UIZ92690.1 DUF3071 domain-containing protein [Corynebacterium sp. CNCTC7651]